MGVRLGVRGEGGGVGVGEGEGEGWCGVAHRSPMHASMNA